jgi:serine/threonine protein kinase
MAEQGPAAPEGDEPSTDVGSSGHRATTGGDRPSAPSVRSSGIEIGARLEGTYEVKKLLGQGAMGAVYLVEHVGLGKEFAAKVVSASRALDESAIARLRNEARITSAIEHENIVNVTHLGATPDGSLFIVMELLRGESLRARLDRQLAAAKSKGATKWLPDAEVRSIVSPMLSALAAAHGAGVVHRDLKPDNVFLSRTRSGEMRPKIVDFGIGKLSSPTGNDLRLTETGQTVGTPLYMAPEQFRAASVVGPAADLYALGVLVYEMLTGELPFQATHVFELVLLHATERARDPKTLRPDLPQAVADVVLKLLAKEPTDRFESASAANEAWRSAWAGVSESAEPAKARASARPDVPAPKRSSSRAWILPLAVIATAALVLTIDRALELPEAAPAETPVSRAAPSDEIPTIEIPSPPPEPSPPPADPVPVATPMRVHHLTSEPSGAEVIANGASVGHTPFELSVAAAETVSVELRLPGRRDVERTIDPSSPDVVHVRLPRERTAARPTPEPDFPGLAER